MKYTQHLLDSFYDSSYSGVIQGADITYKAEDKITGDAVKYYFVVDENVIKDIRFQACGSIVLFASLSAIASLSKNKTIEECFEINEKQVIKEIKQVNRCDYSVVCFAVTTFKAALNLILKRQQKIMENKSLKKVKVKKLITSSNISVYTENDTMQEEEKIEEIVAKQPEIKEAKKEKVSKVKQPKTEIIKEEPITSIEEIKALEEIELAEEDEDYVARKDFLESVPTKIEVRVLEGDDEEQESEDQENEETSIEIEKESDNNSIKSNTKEAENDDMLDEIDSITAKLTDAITKLNFKFDVDEDNV